MDALYKDDELTGDEEFQKSYEDYLEDTDLQDREDVREKVHDALLGSNEAMLEKRERLRQQRAEQARLKKKLREPTFRIHKPRAKAPGKEFTFAATVNRRVVYAREDSVTIRGKKVKVYRDNKGRFAKVSGDFKIEET